MNYLKDTMSNYQRSTFERMLQYLRDDEEGQSLNKFISSGVWTGTMKRRMKSFNAVFEKVRSSQSRWVVPDLQLRNELCLSVKDKLVPAYKSFLEKFDEWCREKETPVYVQRLLQILINKRHCYAVRLHIMISCGLVAIVPFSCSAP